MKAINLVRVEKLNNEFLDYIAGSSMKKTKIDLVKSGLKKCYQKKERKRPRKS